MPMMGGGSGMFNFDPGKVLMGQGGGKGSSPYMRMSGGPQSLQIDPPISFGGDKGPATQAPPTGTLAAETVRATGTGPFDQTYRQNLATYAGGQFARPGGSLTFDPTGNLFGNPTGGGNAPVLGTGTGLLDRALGGQPFSYAPPAPQGPSPDPMNPIRGWQDWIEQFRQNGRGFALNLNP